MPTGSLGGRVAGKVQLTDFVNDGAVNPEDGSIPVAPARVLIQRFESLIGATIELAAANLALNPNHRGEGAFSLEWDKIAGNVLGGVSYTIAPLDLSKYSIHSQVMFYINIPAPVGGALVQVYVALGTDNANLFYWAIPGAEIRYGEWMHLHLPMNEVSGVLGVGANLSSVTYVGIFVQTNVLGATITDILCDQVVVKRTTEVKVIEQIPNQIVGGAITMTGAALQGPNVPCQSITIENDSDRSLGNAVVYIRQDNTVGPGTSFGLRPGCMHSWAIDNLNRLWFNGTLNNVITYTGVNRR